jgi:integrase
MTRKSKHSLTVEQMRLLMAALPLPTSEMVHLALLTSMNIAEICRLQWERVNLTEEWVIVDGEPIPPQSIAVRKQWSVRKGGGAYGTVKAKGRVRNLPITPVLAKLLRSVPSRATLLGLKIGVRFDYGAPDGRAQYFQPVQADRNKAGDALARVARVSPYAFVLAAARLAGVAVRSDGYARAY